MDWLAWPAVRSSVRIHRSGRAAAVGMDLCRDSGFVSSCGSSKIQDALGGGKVTIEIIQCALLAVIAAGVWSVHRGVAKLSAKSPGSYVQSRPPSADPVPLCKTMRRGESGRWEHDGRWVRHGSPDYKKALDESGRAVEVDGWLDEGRQG